MVNGKNVSMFTSYPQSAAWELAHTFVVLLHQSLFFGPEEFGTNSRAARAQAKALVEMLRLLGEGEKRRRSQDMERNRVWGIPIDWMKEADCVEGLAQEDEWSKLIGWAQETRHKLEQVR